MTRADIAARIESEDASDAQGIAEARIFASRAFAHVTDRDCRECDGQGEIHIDMNEEPVECLECCGTGRELQ